MEGRVDTRQTSITTPGHVSPEQQNILPRHRVIFIIIAAVFNLSFYIFQEPNHL
jgi:hypothetical protein